jgi:hypothetical protein
MVYSSLVYGAHPLFFTKQKKDMDEYFFYGGCVIANHHQTRFFLARVFVHGYFF